MVAVTGKNEPNLMPANLHIFSNTEQLGETAATYVTKLSNQAMAERGRFTIALSGGSLPKLLFPCLVVEPHLSQIDWSGWHVFWADERCVPLTDPDSNYRLAREYLFDRVNIPSSQIFPIDDSSSPTAAAADYQVKLAQTFETDKTQLPHFDLILLGMGEDGHTASLFPGHPLLHEEQQWVAPVYDSPKPPPQRITLTLAVINNARQIVFISTGSGKAQALSHVIRRTKDLPAQMVQPTHGEVHWFVDEAAAADLTD
jgi:6-phosphogluconolactonase